jgi:hypothetical protein
MYIVHYSEVITHVARKRDKKEVNIKLSLTKTIYRNKYVETLL